jgi:predicted RNA polymerase sigma factor
LDERLGPHHRLDAVRAHLHERAGDVDTAIELYTRAAAHTRNAPERDHLTKQAARLRATARPNAGLPTDGHSSI